MLQVSLTVDQKVERMDQLANPANTTWISVLLSELELGL